MYADNKHYREYQRMLVKLHALIAGGHGDSAQAVQLRQEMDAPEVHLAEEETIRLNALSGDLSMLHDREIPDSDVVRRVSATELPQRVEQAYRRNEWAELLALLRADVSRFLLPEQVAYMRSRAYESLDEMAPAVAFMDEAARRSPTNANYPAMAMELLLKDQRYNDAYSRAKEYLASSETPGRLILMAGGVVSRQAQQDNPPRDILVTAIQAIDRIERALPNETLPNVLVAALGALGLLAARVGDRAKAESALQRAIDIGTGTPKQLAARGLLLDELELIRGGKLQSAQERSLARQLADSMDYSLAA
jgi:tetratricopeptide (TPR) repeat protein